MDVSTSRFVDDVQRSFEQNCIQAQKAQIFHEVCEDMMDDEYSMVDDYVSNKYSVNQICQRARIC